VTGDQEIKLVGESERGAKAKHVYNDSFVQEALQAMESGILEAWKKSPIRDKEGQLELRLLYKLLGDFKGYFLEAMQTGKMADHQLQHERSLRDRAKAAVREFAR
jgi:hypothetical protein